MRSASATAPRRCTWRCVALGVGPGDEVITVANAADYEPLTILQAGARPVFVDVDERTYTIEPELLEAAITPRTKAIMPVHLYGRRRHGRDHGGRPRATACR